MGNCANVDCDAGRRLGCQTFCCRLLVRLDPDEQKLPGSGAVPKRFVDKDEKGYCVNLDRETNTCRIWAQRPRVCREYECNSDFLLQVAVRLRFEDIIELAIAANTAVVRKDEFVKVPLRDP